MTVCIAAICQKDDKPRIVLCNDWNQETYLSHSEIADKLRTIHKGWSAPMTDVLIRAEELAAKYETHPRSMPSRLLKNSALRSVLGGAALQCCDQ